MNKLLYCSGIKCPYKKTCVAYMIHEGNQEYHSSPPFIKNDDGTYECKFYRTYKGEKNE